MKLKSIALLYVVLSLLATTALSQPSPDEWIYAGQSYDSLADAEFAMKVALGTGALELHGQSGSIQQTGEISLTYRVKTIPVASYEPFEWIFFGNADGSCPPGGPDSGIYDTQVGHMCTSFSAAKQKYESGFNCINMIDPGTPWGRRSVIDRNGNEGWIDVVEEQNGWVGQWFGPNCDWDPPHQHGPGLWRVVRGTCPAGYLIDESASAWPDRVCYNPAVGTIKGRVKQVCGPTEGNPCSPITGNKTASKVDFSVAGLTFTRHYNSAQELDWQLEFGRAWTHNFGDYFRESAGGNLATRYYVNPQGHLEQFKRQSNGLYRSVNTVGDVLELVPGDAGFILRKSGGEVRHFTSNGRLSSIDHSGSSTTTISYDALGQISTVEHDGRALTFTFDNRRVTQVDLPDGQSISYAYNSNQTLESVTYPGAGTVTYHYEDSRHPNHLTGITGEDSVRMSTYAYDEHGRAVSTEHAGGVERYTFNFVDDISTEVTTPLLDTKTYLFGNDFFLKPDSISTGEGVVSSGYTDDRVVSRTDRRGYVTTYAYDDFHRTGMTEAVGESTERTTGYDWDETTNRLMERMETGQTTTYTYNGRGQVLTRTVTDTTVTPNMSRIWTTTYHETAPLVGLVATVDGPRTDVSDVTTYAYYDKEDKFGRYLSRDLKSVTNALGHTTTYNEYDGAGRPLVITDANSVVTTLTYHPRGWLTSRTMDGAITSYDYLATGLLEKITRPDGTFVEYEYDAAHRLVAMEDALGNRMEYTLDDMGNRTGEVARDSNGIVRRSMSRQYNTVNRLVKVINGTGGEMDFAYDANGNQTLVTDPNEFDTAYAYDALNRLDQITNELMNITQYGYDDRDNLTSVTDAEGLTTVYTFNGLDDLTQLSSPDTGITDYDYNEAGQRTFMEDARNTQSTYTYDALGRPTTTDYADASQDRIFEYDTIPGFCQAGETSATGRTFRQRTNAFRIRYCYDARGNVSRYRQNVFQVVDLDVDLTHDLADNLNTMTYPSGLTVTYSRDAAGRIISVSAAGDGVNETLINNIQYEPFGPMTSWTYGNGINASASHDLDYRVDALVHGSVLNRDYVYDDAGNITGITDLQSSQYTQAFGYDELHRLETAAGDYGTKSFTYDGIGNRETKVENGATTSVVMETNSHRIATIDSVPLNHDATGNITQDNLGRTFTYGDNNRMTGSPSESATYAYNAKGERASKTVDGVTTYFLYGLNGELLGEYDASGEVIREYIWVNGQIVTSISPSSGIVLDDTDGQVSGSYTTINDVTAVGGSFVSNGGGGAFKSAKSGNELQVIWNLGEYYGEHTIYVRLEAPGFTQREIIYTGGPAAHIVHISNVNSMVWYPVATYNVGNEIFGPMEVDVSVSGEDMSIDAVAIVPGAAQPPDASMITYYHNDHLGTPQVLTDEAGNVVWQASYHPFGETDILVNTVENNIRFPGQYFDAETSLHYNYFRDYNPDTGRYVESDPIGLLSGVNTFAYVDSNPAQYSDPMGLCKVTGELVSERWYVSNISLDWGSRRRNRDERLVIDVSGDLHAEAVFECKEACVCKVRKWSLFEYADVYGLVVPWVTPESFIPAPHPWITRAKAFLTAKKAQAFKADANRLLETLTALGANKLCQATPKNVNPIRLGFGGLQGF